MWHRLKHIEALQGAPGHYLISIGMVGAMALAGHLLVPLIGYMAVALLLLLAVSVLAMVLPVWPVMVAAALSAVVWNFFFIPPTFTFHISSTQDVLMFVMYFAIAMLNAVLTSRIRRAKQQVRQREGHEKTLLLYNTLLNSLSHELRTPIAAIIGAVDTLKEGATRLSENNKLELLAEIDKASMRLNRQVNNLLNMSRIESGTVRLQNDWCDLNELLHSVIEECGADADGRTVEFAADDDLPLFKLDRGLLEQVLHNVIHNALQHTPPQAALRFAIASKNGACAITIEDRGPGFPEAEMAHVFGKFYRLPNAATGGTGLGLSIVKGYVDVLGGTVQLSNRTGGGARFVITIPAQASHPKDFGHE
ncbi:MAG: PAS domain-containing sensor histidine kinase [Flavobacteriales bacterium]|nr:PAS domain-containing sensor histidine kinase [Flavobacteriales bacterium]